MTFKERFFGSTTGPSPTGTLNKTDWKHILETAGCLAAGTVITYALQTLPSINFGSYTALTDGFITLGLNFLLKLVQSNQ